MGNAYTLAPLSPIRKIIAARMVEAKRTIPHFRVGCDIEMDALINLRNVLRRREPQQDISLNDLLIKASASALMDVTALNVQWAEDGIRQFTTADISVVTAIEGGLATPIVHRAESKSVSQIALEVRELVQRAANNSLKVHEILGGSFSVSNLGMYGVDEFDAIINPPQCAILAVGYAKPRVTVSRDLRTRIATVLRATLSVDHRAIDGATAANFLSALRSHVERPEHLATLDN